MRKLVALVFLFVLLHEGFRASAQGYYFARPSSSAPTYLIAQDFEGTGYDNSETWTEGSTPDEDYATSPAPLVGSQSWFGGATTELALSPAFTAFADGWVYFQFHMIALPGATETMVQLRVGGTTQCQLRITSAGAVSLEHGTAFNNSAGSTVAGGTTYHAWIHYTAGTGADGLATAYISTTATRPGSATCTITTGTATGSPTTFRILGFTNDIIYDKMRVDNAEIGSDPT